MLLYISPKELNLTQFYCNVGYISPSIHQNIHVGVLAKDEWFYQEMKKFEEVIS